VFENGCNLHEIALKHVVPAGAGVAPDLLLKTDPLSSGFREIVTISHKVKFPEIALLSSPPRRKSE
jgi:hypothetical protein